MPGNSMPPKIMHDVNGPMVLYQEQEDELHTSPLGQRLHRITLNIMSTFRIRRRRSRSQVATM